MNVVEHRTPRPRIDFGAKPRAIAPSDEGSCVKALREAYERAEHDRIWRITRQVAEGVNAPGNIAEVQT